MGVPVKVVGALMMVTSVIIFVYYTIWALVTVRSLLFLLLSLDYADNFFKSFS